MSPLPFGPFVPLVVASCCGPMDNPVLTAADMQHAALVAMISAALLLGDVGFWAIRYRWHRLVFWRRTTVWGMLLVGALCLLVAWWIYNQSLPFVGMPANPLYADADLYDQAVTVGSDIVIVTMLTVLIVLAVLALGTVMLWAEVLTKPQQKRVRVRKAEDEPGMPTEG